MGMPIYRPRELRRCLVAQSTMRANAIVIVPPSFRHGLCFIERQEPMLVQALDTKSTIERLDERIIRGLPWPAEVELHAVEVRPQIQAPRDDSHGYGYPLTSAAGIAARRPADRTRSPCSSSHSFARSAVVPRGPGRSSSDVAFAARFPGLLHNTADIRTSCSRAILPDAGAPKDADTHSAPDWPPGLEVAHEAWPADYACSGNGWSFGKTREHGRYGAQLAGTPPASPAPEHAAQRAPQFF